MTEYISKQKVLDYLNGYLHSLGEDADTLFNRGQRRALTNSIQDILAVKAADVQPVRHGRWFHINDEGIVYCSECNNEAYWDTDYGQQLFDYCPYCGAKMIKDGEQK